MAKLFASDAAMRVATDAVQVLGGYGATWTDFPAERYLREAKMLQIVEGTNQIERLVIGRALAGSSDLAAVHDRLGRPIKLDEPGQRLSPLPGRGRRRGPRPGLRAKPATERDGRVIRYEIADPAISELLDHVTQPHLTKTIWEPGSGRRQPIALAGGGP